MQNKGLIKALAIVFALIFLYQLSFTLVTRLVENKAKKYAESEATTEKATALAQGDDSKVNYLLDSIREASENNYLDSVGNETVYNLLVAKYTYREAKEREINLGLDLKGGMNVTLEVAVQDIVRALSHDSQDTTFLKAMAVATQRHTKSEGDFVTLFGEAFKEADPNAHLAYIFLNEFKNDNITVNSTNDEVLKVLREKSDDAIDRSYKILRTRIDRFGVAQPNIQKIGNTGRILVELPGIKDAKRVRKLLQGTAQLEFWETYNFNELYDKFAEADRLIAQKNTTGNETAAEEPKEVADTLNAVVENAAEEAEETVNEVAENVQETADSLNPLENNATEELSELEINSDSTEANSVKSLFTYLTPSFYQDNNHNIVAGQTARVGRALVKDTAEISRMLKETSDLFPRNMKLVWTAKPDVDADGKEYLDLIALKKSHDNKCALDGDVIVDARQDYGQNSGVEVEIQMNRDGAKKWKQLTGNNIGRQIAIVLDDYVYSYPVVNDEIPNGRSSISGGSMTIEEAQDLANILKAGKLPASARILEEQVVGPSLGKESVQKGMWSMIFAFILVLIYMVFFYKKAGTVADIALLVNVFFLFGMLACLGSVLTLPGIAGIVLTLGMAVDSNVIIFERIKEELANGKGLRNAIDEGYKNAYSAIIDGNATTLITGIILTVLGTGPVHSFAVTLCVGILTSLATSIFISRLIFTHMLDKNREISFTTKFTENFLKNTHFDFINFRKTAYIIAGLFLVVSIASLAIRGMKLGIDFKGGRNYVVQFDSNIKIDQVRQALSNVNIDENSIKAKLGVNELEDEWTTPEVKTYGTNGQVKITTKYLNENNSENVDPILQEILYNGVKDLYKTPITIEQFSSENETTGILSTQKVGATIASDVTRNSIIAIIVSLILMFAYIAIRFKKWQYGVASLLALTHDTILVLGMYSLFYNILPFTMEVDQAFIAAVLTVIGYSINATVVIFDRVRENVNLHPKATWKENMVNAVNSTLTRSFNTSGSTLVVLLAIFIFGGETIRGFVFALLVGIFAGTFSSLFIASPVAYMLFKGKKADEKLLETADKKRK